MTIRIWTQKLSKVGQKDHFDANIQIQIFSWSSWNLAKVITSFDNHFTKFHEDWTKYVDFLLLANKTLGAPYKNA